MRRGIPVWVFGVLMAGAPFAAKTQTPQAASPATDDAAQNAAKARTILDEMVKAMGGDAWINMKNQVREGHYAVFFHGNPDLGTTKFYEFHSWPDHDRTEFTTHRDVVQFFIGNEGWEVTYRGKKPLPADQVEEYLRRRAHSIETAVKVWMKDPNTILIYEGQKLAERHLADSVTLISPRMTPSPSRWMRRRTFPCGAFTSGATPPTTTRTRKRKSMTVIAPWMAFPHRTPSHASRTTT